MISRRLNFLEPVSARASLDDSLSLRIVNLNSDTSSSRNQSALGQAHPKTRQPISVSAILIDSSSSDSASTASLHHSDIMDDPQDT